MAVQVDAQFRRGGGRTFGNARPAVQEDIDGRFQFCRVAFRSDFRGDGAGWNVDWPRADINLSIRLSELTKTAVGFVPGSDPNHLLITLTDDILFQCPFVMMTEVGSAFIDDQEAGRLRDYLLKGGFLWADDFWGEYAWQWWEAQLRKVLPAADYAIVDLAEDHALFRSQFEIKGTPQIAAINFWAANGGYTAECGRACETVNTRAVLDRHGRIMVLMTHNTDLGDSFEREADDPQYFYTMSVPGYAFGVNALLYALTH